MTSAIYKGMTATDRVGVIPYAPVILRTSSAAEAQIKLVSLSSPSHGIKHYVSLTVAMTTPSVPYYLLLKQMYLDEFQC